jgi:hypothetical protein
VISLGRIVPASWGVQEANVNLAVRSKYKDAAYIMAMVRPAIVEHVLGNKVQQSLQGKLLSPSHAAQTPGTWWYWLEIAVV